MMLHINYVKIYTISIIIFFVHVLSSMEKDRISSLSEDIVKCILPYVIELNSFETECTEDDLLHFAHDGMVKSILYGRTCNCPPSVYLLTVKKNIARCALVCTLWEDLTKKFISTFEEGCKDTYKELYKTKRVTMASFLSYVTLHTLWNIKRTQQFYCSHMDPVHQILFNNGLQAGDRTIRLVGGQEHIFNRQQDLKITLLHGISFPKQSLEDKICEQEIALTVLYFFTRPLSKQGRRLSYNTNAEGEFTFDGFFKAIHSLGIKILNRNEQDNRRGAADRYMFDFCRTIVSIEQLLAKDYHSKNRYMNSFLGEFKHADRTEEYALKGEIIASPNGKTQVEVVHLDVKGSTMALFFLNIMIDSVFARTGEGVNERYGCKDVI